MKKANQEKQKPDQKKKYHKTCQTLPLRKLVNLQNSRVNGVGDNRHILVDYEWEEDYQDEELSFWVDKIYREWQELTGGNFYDMMFENADVKLYDILRTEALKAMYLADLLGQLDVVKEISDKFRFGNLKSRSDFEQKIKQIEQKIKDKDEDLTKKIELIKYSDLITELKLNFPDVRFEPEITCEEYASWINRIKARKNG